MTKKRSPLPSIGCALSLGVNEDFITSSDFGGIMLNCTVADYIAAFLVQMGVIRVHGLMGGGAAGLNDGFIQNSAIEYLCYHHEQSAGYAAIGEMRLTKRPTVLNPTTGCGATNCYTPVLNAWQDSLPLVVVSGNVNLSTCSHYLNNNKSLNVRSYGVQEHDIVKSVVSITKYAVLLESADKIEDVMVKAFMIALSGRKGPTWIDVPADLQHSNISHEMFLRIPSAVNSLMAFVENQQVSLNEIEPFEEINKLLRVSKRPLLLLGGGVSNTPSEKSAVLSFQRESRIPVVSTYAGTDVLDHSDDLYLGAIGIKGNRAANFATQNCDLLIVLGSRLPFAAVGYDVGNFATHAKICVVDPDQSEINKNKVIFLDRVVQVKATASAFTTAARNHLPEISKQWLLKCKVTKEKWNIIEENKTFFDYQGISIYHVMEELNSSSYDDSNFVVDAGSVSYVAPTALHYNKSRNFIFSPSQADMGCALPSALGVASTSDKRTICITGDGSFMSNLQELATLAYHDYNLTVLVLNNSGYLSITNTQANNYGANRIFGEHDGRGLTFPDYKTLCQSFGLSYMKIGSIQDLKSIKNTDIKIVEILCLQQETIAPYQARYDGQQAGAHDMAPFIDKGQLSQYSSVDLKFVR